MPVNLQQVKPTKLHTIRRVAVAALIRPATSLAWFAVLALLAVPASAQDAATPQSHSDAYWYGRFGYGIIAGEGHFGGPSLGFGRRVERNALGLDILIFSVQGKLFGTGPSDLHQIGGVYTHAYSASVMTVKGLYFVRPTSRTTPYVGVGAGWHAVSFGRVFEVPESFRSRFLGPTLDEQWHGKGIEGELTVGYAFARAATSTRFFVQADITHPFYRAERYSNRTVVVGDRRASSLVVWLGAGW